MVEEQLFNYVDLSIPKIINLKKSLDPEKVEDTQKLSPQILQSLQAYIQQNKDKEPEKMHKILDILKNFAFQNNIINENLNFNTSHPLNISTDDHANNHNMSMSTPNLYPKIYNPLNNININNINSLPNISNLLSNNPVNLNTNSSNFNMNFNANLNSYEDKKSKIYL